MAKGSFMRQFKKGTVPLQHWDESTRVNDPKQSTPEKQRKRNSIQLGSSAEARPGMVGKSDFKRSKRST